MAFVATLVGGIGTAVGGTLAAGAAGIGLGTVGAGAVAGTGLAGGLSSAFAAGTIGAGMLGGGLVGAGIGQLTGGNTKSTLMGAGIGAAGGGLGAWASGGGWAAQGIGQGSTQLANGMTLPSPTLDTLAGSGQQFGNAVQGMQTASNTVSAGLPGAGGEAAKWSLGQSLSNPLFLGQAGLGLASALTQQGSPYQDKVKMSPEGRKLWDGLYADTKSRWEQSKGGKVPQKAADGVAKAKIQEKNRYDATRAAFAHITGQIGSLDRNDLGSSYGGGNLAKLTMKSTGERAKGLYAPTSIMNAFSREESMNAAMGLSNVFNQEKQTGMTNYQGQLANWSTENMLDAQQGAAFGQVFAGAGNWAQNDAYLARQQSIYNKYPVPQIAS